MRVEIRLPLPQFQLECSFQAQPEVVVLFGRSGAGKTSVLDCIAGFRPPQQGRIALGCRTLFSSQEAVNLPVRQRRIGYLSQQPALFPHLSVRHNVGYGLLDLPHEEREAKVDSILDRFRIQPLAGSRPAAISGGEQQRVALARTLVCEPELLLLDEPLSALDLSLKSLLLDALFDWQRERAVPLLYVTHDRSEAFSLSRRVLVMEAGRVVADGEPRQVFDAPITRDQAVLSGYENLFDAVVQEVHPALGTMTCRIAGTAVAAGVAAGQPRRGRRGVARRARRRHSRRHLPVPPASARAICSAATSASSKIVQGWLSCASCVGPGKARIPSSAFTSRAARCKVSPWSRERMCGSSSRPTRFSSCVSSPDSSGRADLWTLEESYVESHEHQDNANIHCQPFPE